MLNVQRRVKILDINTTSKLPEWLTPERIREYKEDLEKAVPYTETEVNDIPFDSTDYDVDRMDAYDAKRILSKYNLI